MNQTSLIIPLIGNSLAGESAAPYVPQPESRPWAPFRTLVDFEVTEFAITSLIPKKGIAKLLAGVTGKWSDGKSPVTLKTYSDMDAVLFMARKYVVQVFSVLQAFNLNIWIHCQFKHEEVSAEFNGEVYTFTFQYRDPWEYISCLISDESLTSVHMWNSVKKYYCEGTIEDQIFDEPNTAETWWNVDVCSYSFLSGVNKTNIFDVVHTSRGGSIPALLCTASLLVRQGYGNTTRQKISNGHSSSLAATEYSKCIWKRRWVVVRIHANCKCLSRLLVVKSELPLLH